MNLYIFEPSKQWGYVGGGLVISAPSFDYLKSNYVSITDDRGNVTKVHLHRDEEEVTAEHTKVYPPLDLPTATRYGLLDGVVSGCVSFSMFQERVEVEPYNCWVLKCAVPASVDESKVILFNYNWA